MESSSHDQLIIESDEVQNRGAHTTAVIRMPGAVVGTY